MTENRKVTTTHMQVNMAVLHVAEPRLDLINRLVAARSWEHSKLGADFPIYVKKNGEFRRADIFITWKDLEHMMIGDEHVIEVSDKPLIEDGDDEFEQTSPGLVADL